MNHSANVFTNRAPLAQRGSALIVAMVFLLLMTLIGVGAMRMTTLQERMAGNLRDNNLALQGAEHALREGEEFLQQASLPPFSDANGLYQPFTNGGQAAFWSGFDWLEDGRLATELDGLATEPRYVVEELPPVPAEGDSLRFGALPDVGFYRVTAAASGGTEDAVVILQTTYRR